MAQQTAVEQLINYMKENFHLTDEALQKLEEAKEMEKQQKLRCWIAAANYALVVLTTDEEPNFKAAFEQYYNETYGSDETIQ